MTAAGPVALGPRHHEVKRLRALLRDPRARAEEAAFVLEGPRLVADALRRGYPLEGIYLGTNAGVAFANLVEPPRRAGIQVVELKEGVLEKLGTTRTPQPVLAVAPLPAPVPVDALTGSGPVLVLVDVADPGNLGTLLRSAEGADCAGVACCGTTVDPFNPKVVRASAGSVFAVAIADGRAGARDPVAVLEALGRAGRRRLGAATAGEPASRLDLTAPVAFVLGNEAHGLPEALRGRLDGSIAVPMAGAGESLNVAMAGTVLAFEAARQRAGG